MQPLTKKMLPLNIDGTPLQTAVLFRTGNDVPLVFRHCFGSTKEDYADLTLHTEWANHLFIAFDAPDCREPQCDDLTKISVPFLVKTVLAVLKSFGVDRFHLVGHSMGVYAVSLPHEVRASAVKPIFSSMVDLSDHGGLMEKFLSLLCPKMFMYGAQNAHLSYLPHIGRNSVALNGIPPCGHFPMYSNPAAMWRSMAAFWATIN